MLADDPDRTLAELVVASLGSAAGQKRSGPPADGPRVRPHLPRHAFIVGLLLLSCVPPLLELQAVDTDEAIHPYLSAAGENRGEIERALAEAPPGQYDALHWLVRHMPDSDRTKLNAEFLLEHTDHAWRAWREAPWAERVPREVFLDAILPYASVSESRESWREPLRRLAEPIVAGATSPAEAAVRLNHELFEATGVRYSTERTRADQSPSESLESGLASCTGLSILLINACRSVGIPARFVGIADWSDNSGNHSWVEIWDGERWRFTGAAEPTGDDLDRAWFTGRAASAIPGDPRHGIYAVTWRPSPLTLPISFIRGQPSPSRAVEVTERYLDRDASLEEGRARVRIVVRDDDRRIRVPVTITDGRGDLVFEGISKDERFDANDHLETVLSLDAAYGVATGPRSFSLSVERDEQLVEIRLDEHGPGACGNLVPVIEALRRYLDARGLDGIARAGFAHTPLSRDEAERAGVLLWEALAARKREERAECFAERVLEHDGYTMPFWYTTYGERPPEGRSLYISMHGGGNTSAAVNDRQWENQKRLYQPEEGVYLAPRAPTNTWNLWHQAHIDPLFDRLIADLILFEDVNPDRVYLMGYSAGGDGVYQLAPRMSDRFAAAAMMAGHPNDARIEGLRNLPFTLHMGSEDHPYDRNRVATEWKEQLAALRENDPEGYPHWVEIHEGKGHWMEGEDAAAVPWMAGHTRLLRPDRVVWIQHAVAHPRYYWLAVGNPATGMKTVVERRGQTIEILDWDDQGDLSLRLDDSMLDLDAPVVVKQGENELFNGKPPRTVATLAKTLRERNDPKGLFPAEVTVTPVPSE